LINVNATDVFDDINLTSVSVYLDGVLNQTNSSGLNNSLYNFLLENLAEGWHNWSITATDNNSQSTSTETRWFSVDLLDITTPTYSNLNHNSTTPGELTLFSSLWNDETSLSPNGQYIFSTNNTGTWVNESVANFTTTPSSANVTKVLNSTEGMAIGYRWYAKDNASNWNDSEVQVLSTTEQAGPIELTDDLTSYYALEETSYPILYDEMGNNDGTIHNDTLLQQDGKIGKAFKFDGIDDFANTSYDLIVEDGGNFSWQFWIKTTDNVSQQRNIIKSDNGDFVGCELQQTSGDMYCHTRIGAEAVKTIDTGTPVNDGDWHFIVLNYNGNGNMEVFVDNVSNGTVDVSANGAINIPDFFIGAGNSFGNISSPANATLDEVGFRERLLSIEEINQLWNNGSGLEMHIRSVYLNSPINNSIYLINNNITFNATASTEESLNIINISIYFDDIMNETINVSEQTVIETFTKSFDTKGNYSWKIEACDNESICFESETRNIEIINYEIASESHNPAVYETDSQTFIINITDEKPLSSVDLVYNGIEYTATRSGNNWSRTINIPIDIYENITYYYKLTYSDSSTENTTLYYQNITVINLTYCTSGTPHINFTFKDESDDLNINATIPTATFLYYLGDGTVNKTLSYINNTAHDSYAFCFTPIDKPLNLDYRMQYESDGYPQRTSEPDTFVITNSTTNKVLYLLGTVDGIYVTFQVVNPSNQLLSGVEVTATREIESVDTVVGTGTTGASGSVTFWLNPDFQHDFSFSKSGFTTYEYSDTPTQTSYTITLTPTSTSTGGGSNIRGMDFSVLPTDNYLENDTIYTFAFNLTSGYWDVSEYGFDLRLANGTVITGGSTTADGTELTLDYNTTNLSEIHMDYYWAVDGNYTNGSTRWIIFNTDNTDWSLDTTFDDFETYVDSGLFGLDDFGRMLITFLIIFITVGIMSFMYGFTSPMAITTLIFGIVFFLDVTTGLMPDLGGMSNLPTFLAGLVLVLVIINEVRLR